ncbi:MAG: hypothetical protein ABIH92_04655, partial [Nanoarchaeota archaeon]
KGRFDALALQEYKDSLFAQHEYIQFFFTKRYSKEWGVRTFLNYAFLQPYYFEGKPEENGALPFLERKLKNISHCALTKREDMMREMDVFEVMVNPHELESMLLDQIPRLRKMISDYNLEMGFETPEQAEAQRIIQEEEDSKERLRRIGDLLGTSKDSDIVEAIKQVHKRKLDGLPKPEIDESLRKLVYRTVLNYEDYCAFNSDIGAMEVCAERFHFWRDRKTGRVRFYSGDLDRSVGHENFHRLQAVFSRQMPPGLRHAEGEYNVTGRTIMEGVPTVSEHNFLNWLDRNRRKYGLSAKDIEIARLHSGEHFGNRLARLCHAIYHRIANLEGGDEADAHRRLATVSGIPVYADEHYLGDESVPEVYYYAHYLFGEDYVNKTLVALHGKETQGLGSSRKATNFIRRNEPIAIQGLLTGNWGWSTHQDFFLKHFWPKARKYCE